MEWLALGVVLLFFISQQPQDSGGGSDYSVNSDLPIGDVGQIDQATDSSGFDFGMAAVSAPVNFDVGGQVAATVPFANFALPTSDIASYAQIAGFSGNDLATAVAVALAESGGNPSAYNPELQANTPTGMGSYGLWQIYLKAHPEFAGWDLTDPAQNARAAFSVYQAAGRSFRPWSTFKSQRYAAFLDAARGAINQSQESAFA